MTFKAYLKNLPKRLALYFIGFGIYFLCLCDSKTVQQVFFIAGFLALMTFGLNVFFHHMKRSKNGLPPVQKSEL